ncbi:Peptidase S8 subtilisin-related protein [Dioscorea alata]|uniref:Peptidase S8 subtilisin-related protein n=1 Tax=Dioscorea alata TaxID=55571 RepID=A0ACB7VUA5_DIOAL|nr:Peptidase S8 subtilisin-related protein [Dioscorea alata]
MLTIDKIKKLASAGMLIIGHRPAIMVYIVYMGDSPEGMSSIETLHVSMLDQVLGSGASEQRLIRSYKRSFNAFAAELSEEEMKTIADMNGVVSVFPNEKMQLHTTQSWDFMGFPRNVHRAPMEGEVIIGMLDTGIWPESESFNDDGFGPPPSRWKGICQSSPNFTCNNKIIGARFYLHEGDFGEGDIKSPRDAAGHGSHTSSTAAGNQVCGANLDGLARGTARGGVPSARIAVYKICWIAGACSYANILAAFDDAIADGVDIISLSVGASDPFDYFEDPIAIGAYHAMKKGILTSNSAGNSGPGPATVTNVSPWSLSVAASTINRRFVSDVKLGNGQIYEGAAVNLFNLGKNMYPLVYGGDVPNTSAGYNGSISRYCGNNTLDRHMVKGKIVLCDYYAGVGPVRAGAAGCIVIDDVFKDTAYSFPLPATVIGLQDGQDVAQYINISSEPVANIYKSKQNVNPAAPFVVSFSSRGPNAITKDILKPDLAAPGVDILAAWSPVETPVPYNIISGTSMACPHATAVAAYVKSFNPTWSPSAIKSALMTTAAPMMASKNTDAEFAYGSGHLNPAKAADPGLVYDACEADYVNMLCSQGYSTKNLRLVTGDNSTHCSRNRGSVWDLNYPSFALSVRSGHRFSARYPRTVTNVGLAKSVYRVKVTSPQNLK